MPFSPFPPPFAGLQTRNLSAVLLGSAAAAVLAIVLDGIVRLAETGFERRSRARVGAAVALLTAIAIASVGFDAGAGEAARRAKVRR